MVEEDINLGGVFESATGNKTYVKGLNLLEIKSEILLEYTGFFEMIGSMLIGEMEQKTNYRFRNVEDFETYNFAINVDYDSEDVFFTSWLYQIFMVNRSQYGRGTDFTQDIV